MPPILRKLHVLTLLAFAAFATAQQAPAPAKPPTPAPAGASAPTNAPATAPASGGASAGDNNATLADRLPPEQVLMLEAEQDKFLARFIPDLSGQPRGAVIVLHDSGQHPSWPFTAAALIDNLPLHGWATLSIELPVPAQDKSAPAPANAAAPATPAPAAPPATPPAAATPPAPAAPAAANPNPLSTREQQVQARIGAAMRHLAGQQQANIVLIGFGSGAYRAAEFVRQLASGNGAGSTAPITALALIAPTHKLPDFAQDLPKILPATGLPTLDLALHNEPLARAEAEQRRRAVLHQRERIYQQIELPRLNGDIKPGDSPMVKRVRGFIQQQVGGTEEPKSNNGKPGKK